MAIMYGVITKYLTRKTELIDNGPYDREQVVQDLDTILSPVLMQEMSRSVADQFCPRTEKITPFQLKDTLDQVSGLVNSVVGGEYIAQRMFAAVTA